MKDLQLSEIWNRRPLIISGPCSAETEDQVITIAKELSLIPAVSIMRAGIWKPRTKPGNFEGVGKIGLNWLKEAKNETGLFTAVEVANSSHVEQALANDVDVLWIGARTTANPFSVQEIAESLKGVKVPVLIKNPINPDLELWSGALERIEKSGIEFLGLVHRGFSSIGNKIYRNPPMWQLAIEMKRRFPGLPMLCDPSHICGNRLLLQDVAQKSINLNFSGLMIESHINHDNAWSDAEQQITPTQLSLMINALVWRSESVDEIMSNPTLLKLREQMDQMDDELISLLSNRMKLADEIGFYKKENNLTILQTERWNLILKRALIKAEHLGLSEDFIVKYFEAVHLESINHQNSIMNSSS
jgi:chorismate mutase